jgi:NitT/TauT family transport system substrate-binding protein
METSSSLGENTMNRRALLGLMSASAAAAVARPLRAADPTLLRIGTVPVESLGGVFYAQDKGFFAKNGLRTEFMPAAGGAAVGAAIIGGDLDIGSADPVTIAVAHGKGIPFVAIAPGELHSTAKPTLAVVVKDPLVKAGKDFNGKTLACNVPAGYGSLLASAWIDNNGGDSKTVKWIGMPFPSLAAALDRGAIDAYIAPEPFVTAGVQLGCTIVPMDKNPLGSRLLASVYFTTRDYIAKNAASVAAFRISIQQAHQWANANLPEADGILSKYDKVPLAAKQALAMRGTYQERFDDASLQPLIDGAAKYGMVPKTFPAREMYLA